MIGIARETASSVLKKEGKGPGFGGDLLEPNDCEVGSAVFWARLNLRNAALLARAIEKHQALAGTSAEIGAELDLVIDAAYRLGRSQVYMEGRLVVPPGQEETIDQLAEKAIVRRVEAHANQQKTTALKTAWESDALKIANRLRAEAPDGTDDYLAAAIVEELASRGGDSVKRSIGTLMRKITDWKKNGLLPPRHSKR